MTAQQTDRFDLTRRTVIGGLGGAIGGLALSGEAVPGSAASEGSVGSGIVLRQGDRCLPVTPLSGEETVEDFYDYRLPEKYVSEANGANPPGSGPYFSSVGTMHLQRDGTSLLFLYDGPDGLSLVVVHGDPDSGTTGGGAATFEFAGLPEEGSWEVRDDYYLDPDSGQRAETNYDEWHLGGSNHVVDWTWGDGGTDGGAFRGLGGEFSVSIDPAFNNRATLFGQYYEGTVESWELLVPDGGDVRRLSLDMTAPVTIETGGCGGDGDDGGDDGGGGDGEEGDQVGRPEVVAVEFKGCGEVWIVFEEPFDGTVDATVETSTGRYDVAITADRLQRVPGQFGDQPLYKWRVEGRGKILAAEVAGGRYVNDHECTRANGDDAGERGGDDEADGDEGREGKGESEHGDTGEGGEEDVSEERGEGDDDGSGRDEGDGNGRGEGEGRGRDEGEGNGRGKGEGGDDGRGHGEGESRGRDEGEGNGRDEGEGRGRGEGEGNDRGRGEGNDDGRSRGEGEDRGRGRGGRGGGGRGGGN